MNRDSAYVCMCAEISNAFKRVKYSPLAAFYFVYDVRTAVSRCIKVKKKFLYDLYIVRVEYTCNLLLIGTNF